MFIFDLTKFIESNMYFIIGGIVLILLIVLLIIIIRAHKKRKPQDNDEVKSGEKLDDEDSKNITEIKQTIINETESIQEEFVQKKEEVNEINLEQDINKDISKNEDLDDNEVKKEEKKYTGKWVIKKKSSVDYVLYLIASNGEIIITSESYVNIAGASLGLETMKKNINMNKFQVHSDKNNHYFFKLKDLSNKLLGMGQVYPSKKSCIRAIGSAKKFAVNAVFNKEVYTDSLYIEYKPKDEKIDINNIKDAYRGKWTIVKYEGEYQAKLYASNGEVLLVTERYASTNSVYNAINTIKKNAEENNFIIDSDKNKKYFYRLRNNQKLTLCIGEAYETIISCNNSIESVKRFCLTAPIEEDLDK